MSKIDIIGTPSLIANEGDFLRHLNGLAKKDPPSPFFVVIIQIANMDIFRRRRAPDVVSGFFNELGHALRRAIHPSQCVGRYRNGFGIIFEVANMGVVDTIANQLLTLIVHVIRKGKYNDLSGRWSDIIYQFLHPNNPGTLVPQIGWAVFPRDGITSDAVLTRALRHIQELAR
ncbi:MAG: hypothetical protein LHV69_06805 [Elusimicrobia bacterium]|nr:hypothetical protein [Candidatus Obscuribacterium magneticum]